MLLYLSCSPQRHSIPSVQEQLQGTNEDFRIIDLPAVPGRRDLKFLDPLPSRFVTGTTPSLADIAAQPDVKHLDTPQPDPHPTSGRVRLIVHGSDAALAAVVSKLMRMDALWIEVAFIPSDPSASPVARNWGLGADATADQFLHFALHSPAMPTTLMRDDHGQVVLGAAEITGPDGSDGQMVGEAIVDSDTLYSHDPDSGRGSHFTRGVRMMPTMGAPGLVAVPLPPQKEKKRGWWARWRREEEVQPPVLKGRALQAGGVNLQVTRDGAAHPRPLKSVTFYRHLRDGQFVRN